MLAALKRLSLGTSSETTEVCASSPRGPMGAGHPIPSGTPPEQYLASPITNNHQPITKSDPVGDRRQRVKYPVTFFPF
jgi:hypothetical protein